MSLSVCECARVRAGVRACAPEYEINCHMFQVGSYTYSGFFAITT